MSLLEDVFLEDEAGEAQELERVIDGDEFDERPLSPDSDGNEEKEDEAEEDKRRVDPTQGKTKRVVKNPRFVLNPARLTGPRGMQVIPEHFKDFKFKGKGHEKEDLDMVLKKLEHWAYRLYPKFEFSDCLKKIETLGKKRTVMVHLYKIRNDQITSEETVIQKDSSDEEDTAAPQEEDEFDKLLQQQIELARSTPMSVKKTPFLTPSADRSSLMPKVISSPSINEEQRERMLRNRQLAEEKRLAKLKNSSDNNESTDKTTHLDSIAEGCTEIQDEIIIRKHNRSNVIDSSSSDDEMTLNESISVEVHSKHVKDIVNVEHDTSQIRTPIVDQSDINTVIIEDDVTVDNYHKKNVDTANQNGDKLKIIEDNVETDLHVATDDISSDKVIVADSGSLNEITIQPEINDKQTGTSEITERKSQKEVSNKENGEIDNEIMDVDFDDDFQF